MTMSSTSGPGPIKKSYSNYPSHAITNSSPMRCSGHLNPTNKSKDKSVGAGGKRNTFIQSVCTGRSHTEGSEEELKQSSNYRKTKNRYENVNIFNVLAKEVAINKQPKGTIAKQPVKRSDKNTGGNEEKG